MFGGRRGGANILVGDDLARFSVGSISAPFLIVMQWAEAYAKILVS